MRTLPTSPYPHTNAEETTSIGPTAGRQTETRMSNRRIKHVIRALRACVGNAFRRSNSDRHIVQAVARPPICVPGTCKRTEHHVCSGACQDAQKKDVFKDFNLSMYESKELVTERNSPAATLSTEPCSSTLVVPTLVRAFNLDTFLIEPLRQEVHIVLVGLKPARSHRDQGGRREELLRLLSCLPSRPGWPSRSRCQNVITRLVSSLYRQAQKRVHEPSPISCVAKYSHHAE